MAPSMDAEFGILGGGLAGLIAGDLLGRRAIVLEAGMQPGGNCRSQVSDGFTFDVGGPHVIISRDEPSLNYFRTRTLGGLTQTVAGVAALIEDQIVSMPLAKGLLVLAPNARTRFAPTSTSCTQDPSTLSGWLSNALGNSLAACYATPYCEKMFCKNSAELDPQFAARRFQPLRWGELQNAPSISPAELPRYDLYYPQAGGIQSLIDGIAQKVARLDCNTLVRTIRRHRGGWRVSDGRREYTFAKLISTLDLGDLCRALSDPHWSLDRQPPHIKHTGLLVLTAAFEGQCPTDVGALQIPAPDIPFYRLSFPGNFSARACRPGTFLVQAEISISPQMNEVERLKLAAKSEHLMYRLGFGSAAQKIFSQLNSHAVGYHIRDQDTVRIVEETTERMSAMQIFCIGRHSAVDYLNMDDVYQDAVTKLVPAIGELAT